MTDHKTSAPTFELGSGKRNAANCTQYDGCMAEIGAQALLDSYLCGEMNQAELYTAVLRLAEEGEQD